MKTFWSTFWDMALVVAIVLSVSLLVAIVMPPNEFELVCAFAIFFGIIFLAAGFYCWDVGAKGWLGLVVFGLSLTILPSASAAFISPLKPYEEYYQVPAPLPTPDKSEDADSTDARNTRIASHPLTQRQGGGKTFVFTNLRRNLTLSLFFVVLIY